MLYIWLVDRTVICWLRNREIANLLNSAKIELENFFQQTFWSLCFKWLPRLYDIYKIKNLYRRYLVYQLPPPDSQRRMSALNKLESSSRGPRLMLISSRIAACGQPPVSTARILSSGSAPCFIRNSPSSFVNMSLVT